MKFLKPSSIRPIYKPTHFSFSSQQTLSDVGPMASHLKTRSVVRFRGPDTLKFLQALLTNDVRRFGNPVGDEKSSLVTPNVPVSSTRSMYAALLTPQGRFLFDLFLYEPPRVGEKLDPTGSSSGSGQGHVELLADVDCSVVDELFETLKRYKVRSKVDIENVGEEFSCWQRFGTDQHKKTPSSVEDPEGANVGWGGGIDVTGSSSSQGSDTGFQWHKDPRLDCLGFRGIFPSNTTPPLVEANTETDEGNYLLWRLEKGVAEGSIEIPKGEAIPFEYNLVGLNAISFDKGCYMGQEFVARSHHRGVIRKRLLPLKFLNESGDELQQKVTPSSEVLSLKSGKKAGTVTTALGSRGLGLLRLEEAFKGSGNLVIKGQEDVKVEPIRPEWWPTEWFSDHEPQQESLSG